MHVVQRVPRRIQRRMHSPYERVTINGVGLGEVDGMFNIGKMFTRMFTFKKHSFDFKNILGATGSVIGTIGTGGIGTIVAPKQFGAHGKVAGFIGGSVVPVAALLPQKLTGMTASQRLGGYVSLAAMAAVGAAVAAPAIGAALPSLGTMGSGLMSFGSTAMKFLGGAGSGLMSMFGGGGGGGAQQSQQGGMTQAEYDAQQQTIYNQQQAQTVYDAQVRAQQAQMYQPVSYVPETGFVQQPSMQPSMSNSYGDLRSPYTAVTEDGQQVQIDPATGQVVPSGMSTEMMIGVGGVVALGLGLGWYFMSGPKSTN